MSALARRFRLDGKKAVVVGGGGLIGRPTTACLAEAGAAVVCVDVDHQKCDRSQTGVNKLDHVNVDISDVGKIQEIVGDVVKGAGGVDVWVNAAYPRTADWGKANSEFSVESWRRNIDLQLNATCFMAQAVAEIMQKAGNGGSIINLGSIYGVVGNDFELYKGLEMHPSPIYAAVKGGVVNFGRFLASRYGAYGIRVNTLCPGGVLDSQDATFLERYNARVPLGRMANPEEVATTALFLASEASSYITGAVLMVDGGWTAI